VGASRRMELRWRWLSSLALPSSPWLHHRPLHICASSRGGRGCSKVFWSCYRASPSDRRDLVDTPSGLSPPPTRGPHPGSRRSPCTTLPLSSPLSPSNSCGLSIEVNILLRRRRPSGEPHPQRAVGFAHQDSSGRHWRDLLHNRRKPLDWAGQPSLTVSRVNGKGLECGKRALSLTLTRPSA
jgi:hypothetical protein